MEQWFDLTDGDYKGFLFHVALPTYGIDSHGVTDQTLTSARRLQVIRRPFISGSNNKDLGGEPRTYTATCVFFGPTYLERLEEFRSVLEDGKSGQLTVPDLPQSFRASFQKMEEVTSSSGANSKVVRVTWIQDEQVDDPEQAFGAAEGLIPTSITDAVASVKAAVGVAAAIVRNNPILATIRQVDTIVSQGTSAVNTAVALGTGARALILGRAANLLNAYDQITGAADTILGLFGIEEEGSGFEQNQVDPDTGETIQDGLADDSTTEVVDPLDPPEEEPTEEIEAPSLETEEGLRDFRDRTIALITANCEGIQSESGGRFTDGCDANRDVVNAIRDMVNAALGRGRRLVLVPRELSVPEVLFFNGVDPNGSDAVNDFMKLNSFIEDPLLVPKGAVVLV